MNGHKANGLLRQVVGGFNAGCGDEREEVLGMLQEAVGQILAGFPGAGRTQQYVAGELIPDTLEGVAKAHLRGIVLTPMNDGKPWPGIDWKRFGMSRTLGGLVK